MSSSSSATMTRIVLDSSFTRAKIAEPEDAASVPAPGLDEVSNLDHIRSYYEALNTGDADLVASHFTDDAVHYYTRLGPHEGARTIGEHTRWAVENIDGQWHIDHAMEDGEQAVIEWAMTW